ncbi:hypothetical protein [Nocardia sp. alder85J]|uniref:hypothetical protein n=1 Tax=Nocardia sp. alder85J TaxID=2862949 RepID=UPI001CD1B8CE|nr:hypothetical protein [Nocardia sp. alder85J]MCX4092168.1 hypothetical protein [Nocardia sp. alder85J]
MVTIGNTVGRFSGPHSWDFEYWRLPAVVRRCRGWLFATRRRRWTVRLVVAFVLLFVVPAILGAVATAQTTTSTTESTTTSINSALSWMGVKDSSGVLLSNYSFATNDGSLLHPFTTVLAAVITIEFAGWLIIVTTGIWIVGYSLSFKWLDLFASPMHAVANSLTSQIALPIVLVTAATFGAFFVAWFWIRGYYAKSVMQVATMIMVAVLGPLFLAEPLADVLSSDGTLAQGRNLGIQVAAGLNGASTSNPTQLVITIQQNMADNFARKPLQVWNFGHVVDDSAACRAAWTSGMAAANGDQVRSGMKNCGDGAAFSSANSPSVGQIGAGLLLLLAGTLLLLFAVVLSTKIIWSALDSVYHGILAIFGFAAAGFIYGAPQTFLVRNVVHSLFAGAKMAAQVIFLGVYLLFLGDLFQQAQGQVMAVFVIGAIVEIIAIFQLKRLTKSLEKGNDFVANRFALAIQNGMARQGGGGSGGSGTAIGMGQIGASRGMHMGMLATLGAFSTVSGSPATAWLWGKTRNPLSPYSRMERRSLLAQWGVWGNPGFGAAEGWYTQSYLNRKLFADAAGDGAGAYGGLNTMRGAAAALQHAADVGAGQGDFLGALMGAGFTDQSVMRHVVNEWGSVTRIADGFKLGDERLARVAAATERSDNLVRRYLAGDATPEQVAASMGVLQSAAYTFRMANPGGVEGVTAEEERWINEYLDDPNEDRMKELTARIKGRSSAAGNLTFADGTTFTVDGIGARRIGAFLSNEHASRILEKADAWVADPRDLQLLRELRNEGVKAQLTDSFDPDLWKRLPPSRLGPTTMTDPPARERMGAVDSWIHPRR